MLALAGAALGCDQGTAKVSDGQKGPPPTVVWHYPDPTGATSGTIRAQFDRFLAADTANRQGFCVSNSATPDACLNAGAGAGAVTFAVEYDPVDRVVVLKPAKSLDVGMYKVRVLPPKNDADTNGIRAFDGVPMAKEFSWEFTVDASTMAAEPNRTIDYCAAGMGCLMPSDPNPVPVQSSVSDEIHSCAAEGTCHMPWDDTKPPTFSIGEAFLLSEGPDAGGEPARIRKIIAQRQVAPESAADPDPGAARTTGKDAFGRNMPYIDPKNPGNSFIIYKMIIGLLHCPVKPGDDAVDPEYCSGVGGTYTGNAVFSKDVYGVDGGACGDTTIVHHMGDPYPHQGWVPEGNWRSPAVGEYARLRYRIRGNPMPSPGGAAPPHSIHLLSAWIAAGAPVKDCPAVQ